LTAVGAADMETNVPAASYCTAGELEDRRVKMHLMYFDWKVNQRRLRESKYSIDWWIKM
jgi:hypothetical protein